MSNHMHVIGFRKDIPGLEEKFGMMIKFPQKIKFLNQVDDEGFPHIRLKETQDDDSKITLYASIRYFETDVHLLNNLILKTFPEV